MLDATVVNHETALSYIGPDLYNVKEKVSQFNSRISDNKVGVDSLRTKTRFLEKRVTNLESIVESDLITIDSSTDYIKTVPARSAPYAEITKFGGMSYKSENLIPYPYDFTGVDESNFKISIDNEQRLVVSGVPTSDKMYTLKEISLPVGSYFLTAIQTSTVTRVYLYKNGTLMWSHASTDSPLAFTVDNTSDVYKIAILALSNKPFNNDVVAPMISKNVALPYEPYFEGLRHAKPTAFKSVGVNLFDKSKVVNATETVTGFSFLRTNNTDIEVYPTTIGVLKELAPNLKVGDTITFYLEPVNTAHTDGFLYLNGSYFGWYSGTFHTITQGDLDGEVFAYGLPNLVCEYKDLIFTTIKNEPYSPYKESTLAIPTKVQGIDGYGFVGINENVYNYVEWGTDVKTFHEVVGMVDLGKLNWQWSSSYWVSQDIASIALINWRAPHFLAENYNTSGWDDKTYGDIAQYGEGSIVIVGEETSKPTGELLFALKTPGVHDISGSLPNDNLIAVEGGGTITVENDYGYDVPSEITYQLRSAT
jgi:hypothetical protein